MEQDRSHTMKALSEVTVAQKVNPSEGCLATVSLGTKGQSWGAARAG